MAGIHPIVDALLIEGGQLSSLWHEAGSSVDAADFDPVPPRHDAGIGIKILVAAVTGIEVTGATIAGYDLLDLCVFGTIIENGNLSGVKTSAIVSDR